MKKETINALNQGRATPQQQREAGAFAAKVNEQIESLIQKLDQSKSMNKSLLDKIHGSR